MKDTKLRPGLVSTQHYRYVAPPVWEYFFKVYGGGPVISGSSNNIYSSDLSTSSDKAAAAVANTSYTARNRPQPDEDENEEDDTSTDDDDDADR